MREGAKRREGGLMREQVRARYAKHAVELKDEADGTPPTLGLGDVVELASLRAGETVLDLGPGPGRDLLAAARAVGSSGRAIGVDMTPEMRARASAAASGLQNVSILDGDLERLPVACGVVDVVISNCVINLVEDKRRAIVEAYRVLRPGGRIAVLDVAFAEEPAASVREDPDAWCGCVGGALVARDYESLLGEVGFEDARVAPTGGPSCSADGATAMSVTVTGRKPGSASPVRRPAVPADLPAIESLLRDASLPMDGFRIEDATVALDGSKVVGVVAVERYGAVALLRSLAVALPARRQGIGRGLTGAALDVARWSGAETVYALTTGASSFLERLRFEPVSRARGCSECPSPQLESAECDGAATLRLSFEEADLPLLGRPSRKPLPTFQDGACC